MLIRRRRGYEIPESQVTPEHLVVNRRALMGAGAALLPSAALAQQASGPVPPLPEHQRNLRYRPEREITPEREATTYNNFYEFGTSKNIVREASRMPMRPWTIQVDGMVAKPATYGVDDLIRLLPIEERIYRLRCVEAWAMTVPWTGFQLSELLKLVEPTANARYVSFTTAQLPAVMPGLRQSWYPWPHVEGCSIAEAMNELTFMPVGMYGKPLLAQNGGPFRVVFPWKYGFKSGKSVVRITLTDRRPENFWFKIQPSEYGFWANVNPEVAHPRWSQATERLLGSGERVPTRIFNGYGEFVAGLYTNMQRERLWA
ncbi:protein-methionine-sulfoxide reductase catalytic subunit MsrP [Roseococcus sp. SDR]|uniref:protein-methionine-sulfoxide reductase catalytic subunit MsrP n=1 Tax=Roseococcus sp. SDR TaxID=2835532 RepID=UPI001BCB6E77|nr:protein-methionine-sulfoxide reductase catalytic subunit MsrP [Roseococcus sp. SDR]MBS7792550.1 protein-methionine-sulfoxide reductase catalytic subunit MsrP [Roseococcus sp. SDR]MBV1847864.1 protein-methionine-sulfoxide reductase catalytic subunit MsrP [Roseococcus sp. SDR]